MATPLRISCIFLSHSFHFLEIKKGYPTPPRPLKPTSSTPQREMNMKSV